MIDIIIPVYNTKREYINQCIDSIINQTYKDWKCFLIDDGSDREVADYLDSAARRDERISVYHKTNGGVSSARNMGLDNSASEYVMFVDADDYLPLDSLEIMFTSIQNEKADLVCFNAYNVDNHGTQTPRKNDERKYYIDGKIKDAFMCEFLASLPATGASEYKNILTYDVVWGKIFKREVIGELRFSTELWAGEDKLFMFGFMRRMNNLVYIPQNVYCYRLNLDSITHTIRKDMHVNTDIFLKNMYNDNILDCQNEKIKKAYYLKALGCLNSTFWYHTHGSSQRYKCTFNECKERISSFPYKLLASELKLRDVKGAPKAYLITLVLLKSHMARLLYLFKTRKKHD